jgi:hypothetical protein
MGDHPSPSDLYPYFWRNCYDEFDDAPQGFFSVYRNLFELIDRKEKESLDSSQTTSRRVVDTPPSFGSANSSPDEVLNFYNYWRSFSTKLAFEWVEASPFDAIFSPYEFAYVTKSMRKSAIAEYNRTVYELLDHLDRCDSRLHNARQIAKEQRKLAKRNARMQRYGDDPTRADQRAEVLEEIARLTVAAREWIIADEAAVRSLEEESEPKALTKTEKEKHRKAQSKIRSVFRKLMKTPMPDQSTAYTDDNIDLILNYCSLDSVQFASTLLGGEAATKDPASFRHTGLAEVDKLIKEAQATAQHVIDDWNTEKAVQKYLRDYPQRSSSVSSSSSQWDMLCVQRDLGEAQCQILEEAFLLYPPNMNAPRLNAYRQALMNLNPKHPALEDALPLRLRLISNRVNMRLIIQPNPPTAGEGEPNPALTPRISNAENLLLSDLEVLRAAYIAVVETKQK